MPGADRVSLDALLSAQGLSGEAALRVARYWELLVEANQEQNLTRLTSPRDFVDGFVGDVLALREARANWGLRTDQECLDLGSGAGVPGLLSSLVFRDERWALLDSEVRKCEFLLRAAGQLGAGDRVRVIHSRVEALRDLPGQIASKAVGKVEKLYGWIQGCSTWNTLLLLKGRGWEEEWAEFGRSRHRGRLTVAGIHPYDSPLQRAPRVIVRLERSR